MEKKKENTVYNACGHNLLNYKLGYMAHHREMERRSKKGMKQTQCERCGLWLYNDEKPVSAKNMGRYP